MDTIVKTDLEKALVKNSVVLSIASGNSMYPFIKDKTKIILTKPKNLDILDTVLYKVNDRYIMHRIVGIGEDNYIVLGDNCLKCEAISKKSVIGVLVGYYKNNDYIEINDDINRKYFNISKRNKPFIKLKYLLKSILKK